MDLTLYSRNAILLLLTQIAKFKLNAQLKFFLNVCLGLNTMLYVVKLPFLL